MAQTQNEPYSLWGEVQDGETGESLPHASVQIKGTQIGTTTNADGRFALVNVEPDSVTLRISYVGYGTKEVEAIPKADPDPLLIALEPATIQLEEIDAVAESYRFVQHAERASQVTLSPRDVAFLPNVGETDIFRSLQLLPGISSTKESSSGLYVRGGTPDQNLILFDGIPVYHVDHFFGFFSAFNADAIKDVQIYKAGYPARYGGRVSSVVDISGKTGSMDQLHGSAGVNLLDAGIHLEVPLAGKGSFMLAARRSYTDVLKSGLYNKIYGTLSGEDNDGRGPGGGAGDVRPLAGVLPGDPGGGVQQTFQPDFHFYDVNARVTYTPSQRDILTLSFYNGRDNLDRSRDQSFGSGGGGGGTWIPVQPDAENESPAFRSVNFTDDITRWGNLGFSGKWSRQWHPRFYSNALISHSTYESDYNRRFVNELWDVEADTLISGFSSGIDETNSINDLSFRLDNEWQLTRRHKLVFGTHLTRNRIDYHHAINDTTLVLNREQEATRAAVYTQDTWTVFSGFDLTLGLRGVHYDEVGDYYLEPRTSLYWALTERWALKGAYGSYHQFVNRIINENITEGSRDFWLLADGALTDVIASDHYVAGIRYEAATWLVDVEVYRKETDGITEFTQRFRRRFDQVSSPEELFFSGQGRSRGIELFVQKQVGRFTGWGSYTLSNTEHIISAFNDGAPYPALHDQRHELNLVGNVNVGSWNLSTTWIFGSGAPYTAPEGKYMLGLLDGSERSFIHVGTKNGHRFPAYHRLDVAAYYRFDLGFAKANVGASIFNLYDRRNIWYREYNFRVAPFQVTDVRYLGIAPNLSFNVDF